MKLRSLLKSNSKSMSVKATLATVVLCFLAPATFAEATQYNDQESRKTESTAAIIQEAVAAARQDDAALIKPGAAASGVVTTSVHDATVEISKDGSNDARVVLDGGEDGLQISFGLPTAEDAKDASVSADGTTVFADPNGLVDVGVQTLADGAVRALTVINNREGQSSTSIRSTPRLASFWSPLEAAQSC